MPTIGRNHVPLVALPEYDLLEPAWLSGTDFSLHFKASMS